MNGWEMSAPSAKQAVALRTQKNILGQQGQSPTEAMYNLIYTAIMLPHITG